MKKKSKVSNLTEDNFKGNVNQVLAPVWLLKPIKLKLKPII